MPKTESSVMKEAIITSTIVGSLTALIFGVPWFAVLTCYSAAWMVLNERTKPSPDAKLTADQHSTRMWNLFGGALLCGVPGLIAMMIILEVVHGHKIQPMER